MRGPETLLRFIEDPAHILAHGHKPPCDGADTRQSDDRVTFCQSTAEFLVNRNLYCRRHYLTRLERMLSD